VQLGGAVGTDRGRIILAVSTILGAVVESGEFTIECGAKPNVGLMSGVVAQIQPRENMNVPGQECESGCAPDIF
jgi:hypothetical protein